MLLHGILDGVPKPHIDFALDENGLRSCSAKNPTISMSSYQLVRLEVVFLSGELNQFYYSTEAEPTRSVSVAYGFFF